MGGTHTPEPPARVATGVVSVVFVTVCKVHLSVMECHRCVASKFCRPVAPCTGQHSLANTQQDSVDAPLNTAWCLCLQQRENVSAWVWVGVGGGNHLDLGLAVWRCDILVEPDKERHGVQQCMRLAGVGGVKFETLRNG